MRRTLDEIKMLYKLEPDVCDLYVEGTIDKNFFNWYLRRMSLTSVNVYSIDDVNVPSELLVSLSLPTGSNRAKVIALSLVLEKELLKQCRVMCIIDRDSDDSVDFAGANPYLFRTDGNSMELYALTVPAIEKFLLVALAGFPITADILIPRMMRVLEIIFAIRQATNIPTLYTTYFQAA